jgi:hypothetical protein
MNKIILLVLLITLTNSAFCQNDNSLTYVDLIAQNNLQVVENQAQRIINWDEVPFNLEGVKSMVETNYVWQIDSTMTTDTVIVIGDKLCPATKLYSSTYQYEKHINDTLRITIDSYFTITYVDNKIVNQSEEGNWMNFVYYDSGILKELQLKDYNLLESSIIGDTTIYTLNLMNPLSGKKVKSDYMPTLTIKLISSKDKNCFTYQNHFYLPKMKDTVYINKEIIQCKDGNMHMEKILSRHKNYESIESNIDFIFENDLLIAKKCKPEVVAGEYNNFDYSYDSLGNLIKMESSVITSEFEYDDRNNVIQRLDYFTGSRSMQKFWKRDIEYKN